MKRGSYLSIGEVSKLTGVHIKSLRYYERIGVLTPAYIDPDTNYRYYALSQLKIVDIIRICVELGIPLKQFGEFMENDERVHLTKLLEVGKEMAEMKIRAIQDGLQYINNLQLEIQQNDQISPYGPPTRIDVPDSHFLIECITEPINARDFYRTIFALYAAAVEKGYKPGYKFGFLYKYRTDEVERYHFIDILSTATGRANDIITIPAGTYMVRHMKESKIDEAPEIFPEAFKNGQDITVLERELITGLYNVEKPLYELCCSVPQGL